jgi:hypothetical protein
VLAIRPLCHAAWQLDRTWNEQEADRTNIVEQRVTPALLRQVIRYPDHVLSHAESLGGPAYDQFLLRQDWKTGPDEFLVFDRDQVSGRWLVNLLSQFDSDARSHYDLAETVNVGNARLNRWLYKLMYVDSAGGRRFRREHRDRLLQIGIRSLEPIKRPAAVTNTEQTARLIEAAILSNLPRPHRSATPPHLDFLFLDRTFTKDQKSLAMEFWPYYSAKVQTLSYVDTTDVLRLRWNYLARLWPESTVEMFVEAYPEERSPLYDFWPRKRIAHYLLPDTLPADVRFAILSGVRAKLQLKFQSLPDPQKALAKPYHAVTDIDGLGWSLQRLPCMPSAVAFLEAYRVDESPDKLEQLRKFMASDTDHHEHVELFTRDEDPELRRAALLAIRNHPIPRRMDLLDTLLHDPDAAVRSEAATIQEELETLRTAPLTSRSGI